MSALFDPHQCQQGRPAGRPCNIFPHRLTSGRYIPRPFAITLSTGKISDDKIAALILEYFDLRPGAIIRDLDLRRPIYRKTAAYGHFGRDDVQFPWENTDKAADLKKAAGL